MAKKKKKDEPKVVGRLGANGEIAPFDSARVLGRVDDEGNKTAFIQAQNQEIAPTKSTWLKKGALDDSGYAYTGTLDKINRFNASLFMSAVDAFGNVGLGITKPIEGIGDFAQNRFADVQELFGDKAGAELSRRKAKEEWKVNKELEQSLASDNGMGIDDMSFLGTKGKGVAQGLGSVLLASATGSLGGMASPTLANVTSLGTMGVGAAGNAEQEALEQGATRKEARMYGLISGVGETLSEMMFGGLSKGSQVLGIGTGVFDSLDDAVASGLTKKIENKIVKNLIEAGVKATGEGVEEVVSGIFEAAGKKLTYMSDEDIKKLIEDENLLDSFLSGAFSAAISQAPGYVQSITTTDNGKVRLKNQSEIRDYITNLNAQEQQVVEQEIQDRINEEGKITKKRRIEIEKQVIEDLDRGYISADKIEKTLGENYNQERDTRLAESFNERARKTQAYENDISKYDEKQAKVIQKAIDSGLLNNSNKTHDFVDLIAKISADKGVDFDFTNNERINESGFGIKGKTVNGFVKDGVINLNLESNQALNKTVGHEITHVLEGTEVYQELQNSLRSYLGEKEWNNRIKDLSETYKNVENANIENELTSDLVGDYIFNDESFVRSLSTKNPNLFQKIFDEIKYMVKIATAGSKQARELEKAKRMFEKAYRETQANKNTSSIETNAKIKKAAIETRNKENKANIIKEEKTSEIAPKKQEKATKKKQAIIPTKTDITNNENINKIKEKYDAANKITGSSKSVILNDGEKLSGTYKLIEAGEVTPSHNSENFTKSENFPTTEKGTTINDRDYENDKNAQQLVIEKAQNYDGRAFNDNGVIVTKDGIVVSGNDRTMAGEIAARNNTDQAYIDYLKENASQYGFTVEQIESMDHPRVVLELNDDLDYDTQTFAKFNKESKKTKSITEKAKELGKTIDNDTIDRISNVISEYDKIDDVYNSAKASRELLDVLLNKGIIDNNEVSQVYDGNKFTGAGKDLIEATVLGSVISEDNLKFFRNNNDLKFKMMKAAPAIIENKSLGDYSIIDEINNAIEVYKNAQQAGMTVEELNNQTSLFGDSNFDLITKRIAETLEKRGFRNFLNFVSKYNLEATAPANGQVDIFTGEIPSKQDVLTNALNIDDNTDIVSYSLSEDNQGRKLSKEQQEYFKDSKLRNENGELEVVYHTSPNQFTVFDNSKLGENTEYSNTAFGFFVTPNKNFSQRFGDINQEGTKGNTMEMYANITNPITHPFYAGYKYEGEQLDNIVRDYMKATGNEQFISDLEASADEEGLSLYQTYMDMMLGEDPFETADFDREELIKNGYDAVEFVEGLDKDVNYNVSDSNEPVSSYAVFDSNQLKNIDNTNPTSNLDIRYSLSVEEANTTQDNEGRKLNENQLAYFKDSKAVDENGNLVTVYHTMTNTGNQFFEFNPVGTDFYRFGDQVVNYFTDNQDMSGSYADSNYKRAYTKPIKSMEDVEDFIKFQNTQNDSKIGVNGITSHYSIEKNGDGFTLKQTPSGKEFLGYDNLSEEGKVALNRLRANERVQKEFERSSNPTVVITDTLKGWDIVREYKGYPELAELVELYDRESQKLIATGTTYEEQMVIREILKNDLENYLFGTQEYSDEKVNEVIERSLTKQFENEQDLIDNIQNNFQAKYQYAGYINMTNPYVIDTFGENWDSVTTERNEAKSSEYNRVIKDNETKEKLYNLAQESERLFKEYSQSNKPREFAEYSIIKNKINNSELREVVNDMGMFGLTYEGWLEAGKENAELFGEEYKQTLPNSDEKISNYTESLNPAELELVQDLTIGEFVNRYGELYKENMKFGDSSSYFKDQFRTTTGTTLDTDKIGYSNMFDLARYNFDGSSVSEFLDEKLTTNDLVKRIIEKNNSGETNYDGLIMKNVYDYGGQSNKSYRTTGDLYVTFNSNQFKAVDNLNPTDDADIRYQLGNNEVAPTSGWEVRSEDVRLQSAFNDAIAPLQEQVQQLNNSINELKENIPQYKAENIQDEETDFSDVSIENMTADDINYEPFMNYVENSSELAKERQGLRNELNQKKEVFIPKEKSSFRNTVDTLKALFTNKNVEIDNLARESGNLNIKYAGDMVNNTAAEAQSNIENAQTNNEGKAIGRSLRSIFNEAREQGLEEALNDYLLNWSNIDRHKQGKGSNISSEDSYKLVKQYEEKYPELKEMARDVWQYSRNARHNLRDAGIISQEVSDMLGRMYPHYVPYISDGNDSYFVDMGELKPRQAIKRAKGGAVQETLLPVEEALTRYTYAQKKAVRQNDLYKEIVNTIGDNVMIGGDVRTDYTNMADSLYRDKNGNYLTAYVDGEQISTRISDNLYKSLSNELENNVKDIEQKLSFITKPLQKLSQIRRDILTKWSPTFPVTNAMKDVQDALLNTKYTQDFIKNYPSAIAELRNNTELAAQFKSLYGSGTAMGQYDVDSGLYKANKGAKNNNFLKGIASINDLIELAPRYAEFKASLDNGASIQEAMYNAREVTTNFSRGGVITKALNRNGFTFLNASVQGLSKFIRNFSGENGARGITNSLIKATIFGVAPAVFNELAFGSGDDKDEEYEALPDYIKDNYYLIKLSNGTFIRIPKGRMLSVFGSAARRTLEAMQGEEDAFEGFLQNVNSQIGVNNPEENNIFSPLIQAYGTENGTAWYGGDIVPTRLQSVPKGEQYDASTDRLSIFLGEKLGISPYKLNYVLDQYTGGIGDIFLPMMTQEASSDGSLLAPIKDKFTADSTSDNKYVSDFYTKNDELKINANSSKATDEDKLKQKYMSSISSEMAELYKERREIQSSDLPKSTKYKKAQSIKDEINRLAKEGLDNYNNVVIEGNYAQIGDNEYYKNGDTWTKVKDDTNGLGLNLQEKAEYYNVKSNISQTKKNNDGNDKPLVIEDIVNSNLTPEAKANLYTSNYKDDLINPMVGLGVDVDSYLTYKAQNFAADKDSNGKSISGSKKRKVFDYINSMNIPYEQKLILAKSEYNSFNDNNVEILEYINNSDMSYDEKMTLITKLGFKVDGNNVSW